MFVPWWATITDLSEGENPTYPDAFSEITNNRQTSNLTELDSSAVSAGGSRNKVRIGVAVSYKDANALGRWDGNAYVQRTSTSPWHSRIGWAVRRARELREWHEIIDPGGAERYDTLKWARLNEHAAEEQNRGE